MAQAIDGSTNAVTGRQAYFLEVPSARSAAGLSVVSFTAVEKLGEPYCVKVALTHPTELARADYLRKDATFVIDPGEASERRTFGGCIMRFSKTRTTRDFCAYEMELRPKVALLTLAKASRVYQHMTAPQIIEAILRRHGLEGHQFAFRIRRQYPQHKFRLQYQMSDWDYIRLLMEQEGLYSYFVPGKFGTQFGDLFTVGDDIDHYIYQPELRVPYRETAGLESGLETVFDLQTHVETVPASFVTADYNPDQSYERFRAEANIARQDKTTHGQAYVYGTHHLDMAGAKWEAQLRHEAALAGQVIYEGQSNILDLRPARILRMDVDLPDAPNGQVITEVIHSGGRDKAYRNTYKAIPSDRRYRLPIDENKWPRIAGTLSGRVTSPQNYKYAYLTQQGHYVVRLDLDFDEWPKGAESVPLRLAKPFAGARQTGFHFPLIDGTEVAVAFRDGDPNKPYIAHALHHSQHEDLITTNDRWLSRNVIRTQSNNKLRMEDWEGQESIKLSTEYGGKTQLNLGYLVDRQRQKRGAGFELRTSGYGALRGGKGLFITAYDQRLASGQQLDMQETIAELERALNLARSLAASTRQTRAEPADIDAQQQAIRELNKLGAAGSLISAPASIALASERNIQLAAGRNVSTVAGESADISALKRITMAAGDLISLCAHRLGIKLFAAKGMVEIQAQNDGLNLYADKQLHIASANADVLVNAKLKAVLAAAGGSVTMEKGGVVIKCPGDFRIEAASFTFVGPGGQTLPLPALPKSDLKIDGRYPSSH
ncbi:type VI secretion system tip protein VgrG [Cupriavidus pinatubonensis]|uniref:type VI secretion system Vgr family protein n=1 Tax=Cupriavidus pinatubonensis TaxID=248026 RepID=UPI001C735EE0|nr:type VI secretion system Vgr family protein [Cupriavidus pinatubonensis]QYY31654.1 type VI secretion system tip protein VgrG [Cupriavidus pinatubonensis]